MSGAARESTAERGREAMQEVADGIAELREQLGDLVERATAAAARRAGETQRDLVEGAQDAGAELARRGREGRSSFVALVRGSPIASVGAAVGVGLALGLMLRR